MDPMGIFPLILPFDIAIECLIPTTVIPNGTCQRLPRYIGDPFGGAILQGQKSGHILMWMRINHWILIYIYIMIFNYIYKFLDILLYIYILILTSNIGYILYIYIKSLDFGYLVSEKSSWENDANKVDLNALSVVNVARARKDEGWTSGQAS
jgi:hypothetical protein